MKSFEERRTDYFQKLRKFSEVTMKLSQEKKNEKLIGLLLMPRNEKELAFCNYYIMFIEDTIKISVHASYNNLEEINPDNNAYINYLVNFINTVQNNDSIEEIKKFIEPYMQNNKKMFAEILYQMFALTYSNPEGIAESLSKKCNIDFNDEFQVMRLTILMNQASSKLQPEIISVTDEELEDFIEFTKHFHNYYMKGIKDHFNEDVKEMIGELITEESTNGYTRKRNI